jgi:hypothetical protein
MKGFFAHQLNYKKQEKGCKRFSMLNLTIKHQTRINFKLKHLGGISSTVSALSLNCNIPILSQNLGHKTGETIFDAYGTSPEHQRGRILKGFGW